jgi:hypothetical protein
VERMAEADGSESWEWNVCGCCQRHDVVAKVRVEAARRVHGSLAV